MSRRPADVVAPEALPERELLARLGLGAGASDAQLEEAHDAVLAFLGRAPAALARWADGRVTEVDEAYAVLSGRRPAPIVPVTSSDADEPADEAGDWLGGTARPSAAPVRKPRDRRTDRRPAPRPQLPATRAGLLADPTVRRIGLAAVAIAAFAIVAFVGYKLGAPAVPGITATPAADGSNSGLDTAAVAALMERLAVDPSDTATLQDLADTYYAAGDYQTAGAWIDRILALDPTNVAALLGKGAVAFNLRDQAAAETAWRAVLAIDPQNLEAHYDLGFMYFRADPVDVAKVKAEWEQVIALAPGSTVAQTVATHLKSLEASASPSAAASPSGTGGSPAPSSSPAPSASPGPS